MIRPLFLSRQYSDTYNQVKAVTAGISQSESLLEIAPGVNCINWVVGHIVVARCNFLTFLDVPSIWDMDRIMRFIPGSSPILNSEQATPFAQLLADLDRSQEQLTTALEQALPADLTPVRQDRSIAEHLTYYAAHEAQHTGQIELICRLLEKQRI
jgi:uncharacterized damage-inducible protein DinB